VIGIKRGIKLIIKEMTNWILLAMIIFTLATIIGYLAFVFHTDYILTNLEGLVGNIEKLSRAVYESGFFEGTYLIFTNNLRAVTVMLITGMFFGLVPFFSLAFNGFIVGVFLGLIFYQGHSLMYFIAGVAPHGILEIPAIIIAGAYGIKVGLNLLAPAKEYTRKTQLLQNLADGIKLYVLLVFLLVIAAAIEVGITPLFAKRFL
jgi:stage II sporulation protein M